MMKTELLFIPSPGLTHLTPTLEGAKKLLDRDDRLSITLLIMKLPNDPNMEKYTERIQQENSNSNSNSNSITSRLRFKILSNQQKVNSASGATSGMIMFDTIEDQMENVRDIVSELLKQSSTRLSGIVVDMFCTVYIDVAKEFKIPSYVFFTSGASPLGVFNHLAELKFRQHEQLGRYKDSEEELSLPNFSIPVPAKVLPAMFIGDGPLSETIIKCSNRMTEANGIMVNTFHELEEFGIRALESDPNNPKFYTVGPVLNLSDQGDSFKPDDEIKNWLDDQADSSVVFLCFGSKGSFVPTQVKEIAKALEKSGQRFLWSLRKPGEKGIMNFPTEFEDFDEVLPPGFLERTTGVGKVIGWAPQLAVLSHPAVGGFVSHCGWNSTLESIWCGVPVATFPLHAEQQVNAFLLVKELGIAEAIRLDYQKDFLGDSEKAEIVGSDEIEAAIRRLMAVDGVRGKVKEMQRKSRAAVGEGGSSYKAQMAFIDDVIKNIG